MESVGVKSHQVSCLVADGCSVNGVKPDQEPTGDNIWAKLCSANLECLRWWAACHRKNLALRDVWDNAELSPFLTEMDAFLRSVTRTLDMSKLLRDKLEFFQVKVPASHNPISSGRGGFTPTRWNSRQPLVCQLSDAYAAWLLFCRNNSKTFNVRDARTKQLKADSWEDYYQFLRKPTTYLCTKYLADILSIFQVYGFATVSRKDPLKHGAVDVDNDLKKLQAALSGYIIGKVPDSQGHSLARRAIVLYRLEPAKFYIQRGLRDIGWKPGSTEPEPITLDVESNPVGVAALADVDWLKDLE